MLLLFDTPVGYALFKVENSKNIKQIDGSYQEPEDANSVMNRFKLKKLIRFTDTTDALAAIIRVNEGKLNKQIKSLVKKCILNENIKEELAVGDSKLACLIKEKYKVECTVSTHVNEMMRAVRLHQSILLPEVTAKDVKTMSLALAHSISRYKLKFSADKIDTMIIQAISLLDDLDKELNNYIMRCREWYGWHFPELGKIISDHQTYIKVVHRLHFKHNAQTVDISDLVSESIQIEIQAAAEVSMGTEISNSDMENIVHLCNQVIEINQYRSQLTEYLQTRIRSIAPNLTILVGELVGARLIAHAGSLMNLAKHPSSTVQIIGAEKALFRALKSNSKNTPKYGLIYHATIVAQSSTKLKGKASRMLAAKAVLAARCDALGEDEVNTELSIKNRTKLEHRLRLLEEQSNRSTVASGSGKFRSSLGSYQPNIGGIRHFNPSNDVMLPVGGFKRPPEIPFEEEDRVSIKKKKSFNKEVFAQGGNMLPAMNMSSETSLLSEDLSVKKKKKKSIQTKLEE